MSFLVYILTLATLTSFASLGTYITLGRGKILHLGLQGHILAVAYIFWVLRLQFSFSWLVCSLVAIFASLFISMLFARLVCRLDDDAFGVLSIAFHLIVLSTILNWQSVTRGALGIPRIPRFFFMQSATQFFITTVVLCIIWALIVWLFMNSRHGRALEAIAEGSVYTQSLGIDVQATFLAAFLVTGIGSFCMAVLFPTFLFLLSPTDFVFNGMIVYALIVIAAGTKRVSFTLVSTVLVLGLREGVRFMPISTAHVGPVRLVLFGLLLYMVIYWQRKSLFPIQRKF